MIYEIKTGLNTDGLSKDELEKLKNKFKLDGKYLKNREYLDLKLEYLFSNYDQENTILTYWGIFKNRILKVENDFEKDLYKFTISEVRQMMLSIPAPRNTKNAIGKLASLYIDWALKKEKLRMGSNPFDALDFNELIAPNKKVIKSEYYTLDEMLKMANSAYNAEMTAQRILPVLLGRIGVYGKEGSYLANLRKNDVDRKNNIINIIDYETGELITKIPVSNEKLYYWIDMAIDENYYTAETELTNKDGSKRKSREISLYEFDNRILKSYREDVEEVAKHHLYKGSRDFFELNGLKALAFKKLVRCAKFDMLNEIAKSKSKLTIDDFKTVNKTFEPNSTDSSYFSLKEDFTAIYPKIEIEKL